MIDTDLASDAGIHHGYEAGRHLDPCYTPHEGSRHKASQVAHHTTTQGDDDIVSLHSLPDKEVVYPTGMVQALSIFARRHYERMNAKSGTLEDALNPLSIQGKDIVIADYDGSAGEGCFLHFATKFVQQTIANKDRIALSRSLYQAGDVFVNATPSLFPVIARSVATKQS